MYNIAGTIRVRSDVPLADLVHNLAYCVEKMSASEVFKESATVAVVGNRRDEPVQCITIPSVSACELELVTACGNWSSSFA